MSHPFCKKDKANLAPIFINRFRTNVPFFLCYCKLLKAVARPTLKPSAAKAENAPDSRRQGCNRSNLLQTLDNSENEVSSAFPKGKQHGVF